jgi:hypothetical protein
MVAVVIISFEMGGLELQKMVRNFHEVREYSIN